MPLIFQSTFFQILVGRGTLPFSQCSSCTEFHEGEDDYFEGKRANLKETRELPQETKAGRPKGTVGSFPGNFEKGDGNS